MLTLFPVTVLSKQTSTLNLLTNISTCCNHLAILIIPNELSLQPFPQTLAYLFSQRDLHTSYQRTKTYLNKRCSGISTFTIFTIRGLYTLFPTFHLRRTRSVLQSMYTQQQHFTISLSSTITYPKYSKYSSKVSATLNTYDKQ